ncbi:hypothetical protein NMG60_11006265 [Bertholletia excelsa]
MRPTPAKGNLWRLNSPIPYLFGGLALVLGLITVALIILACSNRRQASDSSTAGDDEDREKPKIVEAIDLEPKILVIMPGDHRPTYLATSATHSSGKITASATSSDETSLNMDETKKA